jgi:DNA-binding winged helix-turn-helix (wHTH) protein/tetratricopeptide (TPR) repeat protein
VRSLRETLTPAQKQSNTCKVSFRLAAIHLHRKQLLAFGKKIEILWALQTCQFTPSIGAQACIPGCRLTAHASLVRFGVFELNLGTGELRKNGLVLGLPPQPFKILALLVSRAGELVTRDEIQTQVWGKGTFVDFEHGLNFAVQKIRAVLQDDADSPRYIETLPRRGYRFVANVENVNGSPTIQPNGGAVVTEGVAYAETSVQAAHRSTEPRLPSNGSSASKESIPPSVVPVRAPLVSRRPFSLERIALILVVLLVVAGPWTYRARHTSRASIDFNARDMVLVSRFENRTGEPVLDGTVEFALERELSNSLFVSIAPAQRVQDTLRMMKKPLDSGVDATLGREICLRDGGIRALINGRVEKFGATYTLSVGIINPANGAEIAGRSVEARSQGGILPAVRELSDQLRAILGEKLPSIKKGNVQLERVTTASLPALQFYSRAMASIGAGKWEPAASLLEQAVAVDPSFASAHILLAHCYSNFDKDKEAAPHYQKAFELADATTDRERYFILGSYYQRYHRDRDKAVQAYETLVNLYPDHFFGVHNLTFLYWNAGRWRDYEEMVIRRAGLQPGNIDLNFAAGWDELTMGRIASAKGYFARAQALVTPETQKSTPDIIVYLEFAPTWEYMRDGVVDKAVAEADRLAQTFESRPPPTPTGRPAFVTDDARSAFANAEGNVYFRLGKLKSADGWFQRELESNGRSLHLSNVARARGNPAAARRALQHFLALQPDLSPFDPKFHVAAKLCADIGLPSELEKLVRHPGNDTPWLVQFAKGALAVAERRNAQAVVYLRDSVVGLRELQLSPLARMAEDLLATALERQGNFADAIDVLKSVELNDIEGPDLDARYHLVRLYRKLGNNAEAQKIEVDLLKRLKYADPDHPMLVQLKRQTQSLAARP